MSVALVKPKPGKSTIGKECDQEMREWHEDHVFMLPLVFVGVFVDTVKHLLVLATPTEIRVLGLNTGSGGREDYLLVETQLAVASDHVGILNMVGTKTGRIFMCGNDGHIYELDYQVSPSRLHSFSFESLPVLHRMSMCKQGIPQADILTKSVSVCLSGCVCVHHRLKKAGLQENVAN